MYLQHLQMLARQEPGAPNPNIGVNANHATIIGVSVFSIALATVSVIARFWCRANLKTRLQTDDWTIVIALIFTIGDAALYLADIKFGFGKHIYIVAQNPSNLITFFQIVFATFLLYGFGVSFVKVSVLMFYHRVFGRQFRGWILILGTISVLWGVAFTLVSIFQCSPVQRAWNEEIEGTCIPYLNIFIGLQVANIILDVAILCLPITAVMGLQMAKANKRSVIGTFMLGGLSIVFAIVRLAILVQDKKQTDITYATPTASWSLVEPAFEIFCACLPTLTPMLKAGKYFSKIRSTFRSGSSSGKSSQQTGSSSGGSSGLSRERTHFQRMEKSPKTAVSTHSFTHSDDIPLHSVGGE